MTIDRDLEPYAPADMTQAIQMINRVGVDNLSVLMPDGRRIGYLDSPDCAIRGTSSGLIEVWFGDQFYGLRAKNIGEIEAFVIGYFQATFRGQNISAIKEFLDKLDEDKTDLGMSYDYRLAKLSEFHFGNY